MSLTDPAPVRIESLPTKVMGPASYGWWGMVWLIATEAMMFAALIASYFYVRYRAQIEWPPDGIEAPSLPLIVMMSVVLWSSSISMHLADHGIRSGHRRRCLAGLAVTFILGAAFLVLQVAVEYPETLRHFTPRTNAYGSLFYTITGLHGLHVLVGLALIVWTAVRTWAGHFDQERHLTIRNVAMYWHFVDVVWIAVFLSLYLSPHV